MTFALSCCQPINWICCVDVMVDFIETYYGGAEYDGWHLLLPYFHVEAEADVYRQI